METIFGCFIFMQYKFQGMIGHLDFSQRGWLWSDSNLIAILLWKQTSFRDDKYLACRCSTLNYIQGKRGVTSCEECEDSLEAHKKGKEESDRACVTVPHKLPLKYKHRAVNRGRNPPAKFAASGIAGWEFVPSFIQTQVWPCKKMKESRRHLHWEAPRAQQTGSLVRCLGQRAREWMGHAAAQTGKWSPRDRAMARCHRGAAGKAVPQDRQ